MRLLNRVLYFFYKVYAKVLNRLVPFSKYLLPNIIVLDTEYSRDSLYIRKLILKKYKNLEPIIKDLA